MWHRILHDLHNTSKFTKVMVGALVWLVIITWMHFVVNSENSSRKIIKMGYMPVITNLAAPILDYASRDGGGVRYKALKFASFADMAESLRNGQIDVAFMIAPLPIVMRQQNEDVKIIYIGNRHESTMVTRKDLNVKSLEDLIGRTIAVPMRYSSHNLSILDLIDQKRLTGKIKVVEMNPPDMAAALSAGALDAYYVGEPFAAQTLVGGESEVFFYAEEVWGNFITNLMVVRNDFIVQQPDVVQNLVRGAIRSGFWASKHAKEAITIASSYWNQSVKLLDYAFTTPEGRILYSQYIPKNSEIQEIADMMKKFGLIEDADISGLVDDRFARSVKVESVQDIESIL